MIQNQGSWLNIPAGKYHIKKNSVPKADSKG